MYGLAAVSLVEEETRLSKSNSVPSLFVYSVTILVECYLRNCRSGWAGSLWYFVSLCVSQRGGRKVGEAA